MSKGFLKRWKTLSLPLATVFLVFAILRPEPAGAQPTGEVESLEAKVARLEAQVSQMETLKAELAAVKEELAALRRPEPASVRAPAAEPNGHTPLLSALEARIRDVEERTGITFGAQIQMNLQGIAEEDGLKGTDLAPDGEAADLSMSYDLSLEAPLGRKAFAFILIEGGNGSGITDDLATNLSPNDDAGDTASGMEVTEAWVQYGREDTDRLVLTLGKIDVTGFFDQNNLAADEVSQFLGSPFVHAPAIDFPDDNAGGVRLQVSAIPEVLVFQLGGQEEDADFEDVFDRAFGIGEVALSVAPFGAPGVYRAGVWVNGAHYTKLDDPTDTNRRASGLYVSFDQELFGPLSVFGRFACQDKELYNFPVFWSGGLQVEGEPWGRPADALGVGFAQLVRNTSNPVSLAEGDPEGAASTNEAMLEAYYRLQLTERLSVSPHVQVLFDPAGVDKAPDAAGRRDDREVVIVGTRIVAAF